jgi:biopolymer transport protein ExbD
MAKFKKRGAAGSQSLNTASLPDIVFMLLFFFMVVTKIKDDELKVKITYSTATEVSKIKNKNVVSYIYVGKPVNQEIFGTATRIQLNDAFKDPSYIPLWAEEERRRMPQDLVKLLTVSLKADKNVKMGIITDVKTQLRNANALKIIYATLPGKVKTK